jgi:hypothetical protein
MGYNVIYPILLHSKLRNDLDNVVDLHTLSVICERIQDLLDDF